MSILVEKNGKKVIPLSIYIKFSLFIALIALTSILLRPIQNALSQEMIRFRTNLIQNLENFTGMEVRYSSLRPSFLGMFEIKNLKLVKDDSPFFVSSGIKIHFSIIEFLFRKKTFIHTVQIDYPSLFLDAYKDRELIEKIRLFMDDITLESERVTIEQIMEYLPRQANYQIRHLNVNYTNRFSEYKIENMNLNLKEDEGEILLFGRFLVQAKIDNLQDKTIIVSADAGINGSYSSGMKEGNAALSFFYLTGSQQDKIRRNVSFFRPPSSLKSNQKILISMNPFNMGVTYKDWILNFTQSDADAANNIKLLYNMETGGVDANINLENFKPGSLLSASDLIEKAQSVLQLQITGSASFKNESGRMSYKADIKAEDTLVIDAYGNENEIIINDFQISSPENPDTPFFFQGKAGVNGNLRYFPLESKGTVFFDNFSLTKGGGINAVFDISSHDGEILVLGEDISIAQTDISELSLFLYPLDANMGITLSGFFKGGGALYLDAVFNDSPGEAEAALSLNSLSLFEIAELCRPFTDVLELPAISSISLKNSMLNADIFFSTDFNNIVYNAPNIVLNYGNTNAHLSLSGTDHQITLTEGKFIQDDDVLTVSSNINFSNPMEFIFTVNASYHDLSWNIDGQILDRTTLIVRDPNGFHAYGNVTNMGAISGYAEGVNYPIPVNKNIIYLNFYCALRYDSRDFWNMNVERFSAREANSPEGSDFLAVFGSADQDGAGFKDIIYKDSMGSLRGSADFTWERDFSYLDFIFNMTDGRQAGESYYAKGSLQGDSMYFQGSVSDMHVNRFFKQSRHMLLTADAEAAWDSINLFNAKVSLKSFNMRLRDAFFNAAVDLSFSNDELLISDLKLVYAGVHAGVSELQLNRVDGILKADMDLNGIMLDKNLEGKIALNANFNPIDSWLAVKDAFYKFDGNLSARDFKYGEIKDDNFNLVFAGNDGSLSLRAGRNDMIIVELDSQDNFFASFASPVPIRGTLTGTLTNWNIDAHSNEFFMDISALFAIFSTKKDVFNISSGYITGKADFKGPIWNPEFYGTARASSMRFQAPNYITEDIRTVPFDVIAQGYEMTFGPVPTVCGAGGGSVSGWFFFENWSPRSVGLDINIPRESPIPYGMNITGFLVNGIASGKLLMNVDGINSMMELKGDLFTNEAQLGISMDDIMSNQNTQIFEEDVFYTTVSLRITTGAAVEFLWPAASPILRANCEMGSVIYITSDTQAQQYSLISNVKIRSGELYYFDRNFYIRQGNMVFRENETRFDPMISARAEIRDRTDTGPVVISMIIDNQPLFRFEPRFEANPGLTQLEIYSILGQNFSGTPGDEGAEMAQRFLLTSTTDLVTQLIAGSDVLSQFAFFRQLEKQVRNTFGLDMFSVRTRLLQNMVVTGATELGFNNSTSDRRNNGSVGNFFDNTTVFVGKYIGQYMFAQAMLTLKKDETSDFLGGIRVEPDIGIELQSPFLTIRWDLYPYFPANWDSWVTGNSITLSWSKSF